MKHGYVSKAFSFLCLMEYQSVRSGTLIMRSRTVPGEWLAISDNKNNINIFDYAGTL